MSPRKLKCDHSGESYKAVSRTAGGFQRFIDEIEDKTGAKAVLSDGLKPRGQTNVEPVFGGRKLAAQKGRQDDNALGAFMAEYKRFTAPNPMQRGSRVWQGKTSGGERLPIILTELRTHRGFIYFSSIQSPEKRGAGQASQVLKFITGLADKHGVSIKLLASPYGNTENELSTSQLMGWYKRYGWRKPVGDEVVHGEMIRYPGGAREAAGAMAQRVAARFMQAGLLDVPPKFVVSYVPLRDIVEFG